MTAKGTTAIADIEKPQNGLAGLKHWRHDIIAGLLVSLISLPFSLGIAVASGAPPVAGLVSAIIAGILFPFLGGAYVTIAGPAAGLAPVLLVSMTALGRGNLADGYPLLLAVICIAGLVQIILSYFKAARFSALFPSSVIEGMLAAIGLLIIGKQLPNFLGSNFHEHNFFGIMQEAPSQMIHLTPNVFAIGAFTLVLIFVLSSAKARWLKIVPPQVVAVVFATALGYFLQLDSSFLIHIPDRPLEHAFVLPNFARIMQDSTLWFLAGTTIVTLVLIDGVESLATAMAIDKIDPFRRKSEPNRVLFAMGVSNMCSSVVGGLTIIPGGVKSKACIVAGGRTLWANFYNAIFLLIYMFAAKDLINYIPLSALAAVLIFTGYKLCEPRIWRHVAHIGPEQLFVFATTVFVTLATDLLWGIIAGVAVKLVLNQWFIWLADTAIRHHSNEALPAGAPLKREFFRMVSMFQNPVTKAGMRGKEYIVCFSGPVVCFNNLHVHNELRKIPEDATSVTLNLSRVPFVDHTSCEYLLNFVDEQESNPKVHYEIVGLDHMFRPSTNHTCMRLAFTPVAGEDYEDWLTESAIDDSEDDLSDEHLDRLIPHPIQGGEPDENEHGVATLERPASHVESDLTWLSLTHEAHPRNPDHESCHLSLTTIQPEGHDLDMDSLALMPIPEEK